jgi:hypothetical protein
VASEQSKKKRCGTDDTSISEKSFPNGSLPEGEYPPQLDTNQGISDFTKRLKWQAVANSIGD